MPLGLSSVLFLYGAIRQLPLRYGLEYGEGIVLWQAAHITTPSEAYHPITQFPYVVFHYPPLFHIASRASGAIVGDLLIGGRLVSLLSAVGVCVALGLFVMRRSVPADRSARWIGALAAAGLATTLQNMRGWVPGMRVDMLGLALSLIGTWMFLEGSRRRSLRYLAFLIFVAALFTKHTLVAAPLACWMVAAIEDRKEAFKLAAFAAALSAIAFVFMQWATNGQFFVHLFVHNQNAFDLDRAVELERANMRRAAGVLGLALAAALWVGVDRSARAPRDAGDRTVTCLLLYFVFAFCVSWTCGKFGSAPNYFLEMNFLACALAGVCVALAFDPLRRRHTLAMAAVSIFALATTARSLPRFANTTLLLTDGARELEASRAEEARQALAVAGSVPGPVFSWDLTAVMLANKGIPLEPAIMFDLSRSGKWDMTPFLNQIRQGQYDLIITNAYTEWLPSPEVMQAMAGTYAPAEHFGTYHVYRPVRR